VDQVKKSVVRRFSFPPQEHKFSAGETAVDPVTERGWSVWAVDDAAGPIELKVGLAYDGPLPAALIEGCPIGTTRLRERLRDLGDRMVREGADGEDAATLCCCGDLQGLGIPWWPGMRRSLGPQSGWPRWGRGR